MGPPPSEKNISAPPAGGSPAKGPTRAYARYMCFFALLLLGAVNAASNVTYGGSTSSGGGGGGTWSTTTTSSSVPATTTTSALSTLGDSSSSSYVQTDGLCIRDSETCLANSGCNECLALSTRSGNSGSPCNVRYPEFSDPAISICKLAATAYCCYYGDELSANNCLANGPTAGYWDCILSNLGFNCSINDMPCYGYEYVNVSGNSTLDGFTESPTVAPSMSSWSLDGNQAGSLATPVPVSIAPAVPSPAPSVATLGPSVEGNATDASTSGAGGGKTMPSSFVFACWLAVCLAAGWHSLIAAAGF